MTTAVERYNNRMRIADLIIDCCPIAKKYFPKNFQNKDELAQITATATQEELEKKVFEFCNDAYWNTVTAEEDGDMSVDVEVDLEHINSESELEEWAKELGIEDF